MSEKQELLHTDRVLIVEGKYDAARLSHLTDAMILLTDGFGIYKDKKRQQLFKTLARRNGLILLTDSDAAGFRIRTYITNLVGEKNVVQAYVPAIHGKEKRKAQPGKEGLLGVEGVDDALVLQALRDALGEEADTAPVKPEGRQITYTDLYEWGLSGTAGSAERKMKLLSALGLPPRLSKKELVEALNRLYTDKISEGIDWLEKDIGVKFGKIRPMPYPRLGRTCRVLGEGQTGGARLVQALLKAAEKRGIDIRYEHKAIELLHDDKFAVTGVKALTPAGQKTFMSRGGVCIATGGFSGNPEMVDRYIGGWATRMVLRGSPAITGENISLPLPLFTKFVNMDQFHSGPIIGKTHVNPADVLNSGYGIQVNTSGNRYMDENNTYVIKARTTAQMTLDNTAWVIVDSDCSVLDKVIPKFDRLNSPYGKADTIEELCKQVGLPAEKVKKLVDEYNEKMKAGKLGEMNPPCTYKKPHPIAKAPFYAVPLQGGMTATFGGPLINTKTEIQNLDGKSIPGLYAAGNSAGGIFFHNYAGGAQLGAATVFGRVAGVEMANRAKKAAKK